MTFVVDTALENHTIFLHFFGFGGGGSAICQMTNSWILQSLSDSKMFKLQNFAENYLDTCGQVGKITKEIGKFAITNFQKFQGISHTHLP